MRLLPIIVFLFLTFSAASQIQPLRISEAINLDGILNEPSWSQAAVMEQFQQAIPKAGDPATEKTEARILYDNEAIYVGVRCYDSEPAKILATNLDRDPDQEANDVVGILFDTYYDHNTGIYFAANPLGARYDADVAGNGGFFNDNYNTFWDVKTRIDSSGYTVEFRIPLSSLRFQQKEEVLMGFKVVRLIKHKNEVVYFPPFDPKVQDPFGKVSLCGDAVFKNLKSKRPVYVTPYAIASYDESYRLSSTGTEYIRDSEFLVRKRIANSEALDKILSNVGVDIKYGLTKNLTLDLTANTDFAQVEVDNRVINISKYEINLPEKRTFFLESQNYLNMYLGYSGLIFNSRAIGRERDSTGADRVVPILAGARLTGKVKGLQFGALNMQTKEVDEYGFHAQNFSVFRFRQFTGKIGSFVGGIFTNRVSTDSKAINSRTIGPDFVIKLNEKDVFGGGAVGTFDPAVHEKSFDKNVFYNLFYFHQADEGLIHSSDIDLIEENFLPRMGFIPENDILFAHTDNAWRVKLKGERKITYWYVGENTSFTQKISTAQTETFFQDLFSGMIFRNGGRFDVTLIDYKRDLIFYDWNLYGSIVIPKGYHEMTGGEAYFQGPQTGNDNYNVAVRYSDFYGGKLFRFYPSVGYIFNRYLKIGMLYDYVRVKFPASYALPGENLYQSHLVSGTVSVTLSPYFSIKLLSQYDNLSKTVGSNLRIRYNPKEGTDLYIVYNSGMLSDRDRLDPRPPLVSNQAVTVKFSKTFGL